MSAVWQLQETPCFLTVPVSRVGGSRVKVVSLRTLYQLEDIILPSCALTSKGLRYGIIFPNQEAL